MSRLNSQWIVRYDTELLVSLAQTPRDDSGTNSCLCQQRLLFAMALLRHASLLTCAVRVQCAPYKKPPTWLVSIFPFAATRDQCRLRTGGGRGAGFFNEVSVSRLFIAFLSAVEGECVQLESENIASVLSGQESKEQMWKKQEVPHKEGR